MSTQAAHLVDSVRAVTADEVATFRKNGWVKLEGLYDPELSGELLERLKVLMAAPVDTANPFQGAGVKMFKAYEDASKADELFGAFSHSLGMATAARELMGRPERFYEDKALCKEPSADGGGHTPWHQDFSYHPFDRQGTLLFWMPLVDCPPEKGTMRFLNGSHRAGLLGRFVHRTDGYDILDHFPDLGEGHTMSEPLHLKPGDVTVHDRMTLHYAPANETDSTRWVYTVSWFNRDALYTGMPCHRMDGLGLKVNEPLEHPNFPAITG
ncbi:MAG: phytanoyl-CoA dioxygenase [Conexibacter sp.]|nr:phytanoyl-CoA dioxygenase [Conexibacter sp.]